jgi:hypothetical protein
LCRKQKLRTRKHKEVLLSATTMSNETELVRAKSSKEALFNVPRRIGSSGAKLRITIILISFIFVGSLWLIDVSVGSMLSGSDVVGLTGVHNPTTTYHIGLMLATLSCFMIAGIAAMEVTGWGRKGRP